MNQKNKNVNKQNGGGHYCQLKSFLSLLILMLLITIKVTATVVPHSYITDNPDKRVTQTETLKKYKEKAELNLSVTKLSSKEVSGVHNPVQKKIYFSLDNIEHGIEQGDKIYVSEELEEVPSISTTNGRRKINGLLNKEIQKEGALEYTINIGQTETNVEVEYSSTVPKKIYIGILDSKYQIKKILKNEKREKVDLYDLTESLGMLYNRDYDALDWGTWHNLDENIFDSKSKYGNNTFVKKISGTNKIKVGHVQHREGQLWIVIEGYDINGNLAYTSPQLGKLTSYSAKPYQWAETNWSITLPEHYKIIIKTAGQNGNPEGDNSQGNNTIDVGQVFNVKLEDFVKKGIGESTLSIDETYNYAYIKFDSCTMDNIRPISILNNLPGVSLSLISGDGLLELEATDILEINDQRHSLSSSNLPEQKIKLNGNIDLLYKVEEGKLQLKIDSYGLKINQPTPLNIKITKNKDIRETMEHTINIKVPYIETVIGESDLEVLGDYNKSKYITIKSCTLDNPQDVSLVTPIEGVYLGQYKGKGIVRFEPGDILEVNGVQSVVNDTGGIDERSENTGGISVFYKAQDGNFQVRINDYQIEQESPQPLNIKLIRNGNEIMDHILHLFVPQIVINNSKMNVKIRDTYKEEYFDITGLPYNVKGIEYLSGDTTINVYTTASGYKGRFEEISINGIEINLNKNEILNLANYTIKTQAVGNKLILSLTNYPRKISEPFEMTIKSSYSYLKKKSKNLNLRYNGDNAGHMGSDGGTGEGKVTYYRVYKNAEQQIVFYYVPNKVVGQSTLELKEYYPTPEYIAFNSCTTPDPKPIELENSLRDVKVIQNSGNGLVHLEAGDILELNGKQYTIEASGNLPEQNDTIGNINFKFKIEAGKIRIALKDWGVLEPDRILTINASREGHPIMEHQMVIKAPRRVEGISNLKFNTAYTIRNIVKLQGISLTAPAVLNLETPIPAGVSLKQIDGYGVPFLKEGDILEVGNNITRTVKQYTIGKGDSLKKTLVDLPGTNVSLYVENGKVRVGLNNWLVNKNTSLQLRAIRGTNEICNMQLGLEVPEAPFDVVKNGMLDFGKVIQGSKNRRAETNILLEMHRDISEIKFNLSTRTPEMENENGTKLVARDLETGVYKQGNRRYLVKILGRLDIPEKQEMGLYRGSAILNVEIR